MSSREFAQWIAYFGLEPFGYEMENWRMGVIASTVVNCTPRGRHAKALKPADFFPTNTKRPAPLTVRQQRELAQRRAKRGKEGS